LRVRVAIACSLAAIGVFAGASATSSAGVSAPPRWLTPAEREALKIHFGGAHPIRTSYLYYPRKIAVVWDFDHVVACRTCTGPPGGSPAGQVIRVAFNRATHRMYGGMQFCGGPGGVPRRLCFHR